ncbi:MAG TPA: long-chain fatty acid--CoA ligase [Acidimicrobiia bacterium]
MDDRPAGALAALLLEHPFADDVPLLHTANQSMTAGEARAAARAIAEQLVAAGVEPGAAVAVQLPNDISAVTTMFGVWAAGCVFVPVNPRLPERERETALDATEPAALITAGGLERLDHSRIHGDDVGFVLWTSGTTGRPKPILHTHTAYLELLDRVLGPLRGGSADAQRDTARTPTPNLIPVALSLNAGIYNVLFGLRAGAAIVIMDGFTPATFAELVQRFAIRSTVLPPAAIAMLNDADDVEDLAPLRYVRSITAPLSPLAARRFVDRFGVSVLNGYGQAEIGEVIGWTAADAREHPDKVGAVGRPHPGVAIRIASDDGTEAPAGVVGALLVRPPSMAAGYASGDELDDRVDASGYVNTGDLARVDEEGFVWIEGRAGDLINRGGNKVFPEHVEEVLRLAPEVVDAAVIGRADERLGEVPVAFVVEAAPISDDALAALCREHLVPYKVPVAFRRVDTLPRNEAGKLRRAEISAMEQASPTA